MQLTVEMPWEVDLSVNASHFGPGGHYRRKPHVQAWMRTLAHVVNERAQAAGLEYHVHYLDGRLRYTLLSPEVVGLPLNVLVHFCYPDKRTRDDSNYYKALLDAVADGLGIDDKNIRISTGTVSVDKKNPGFTITVEDEG